VLVNTARGEIIDEAALVSPLRSGHIYAAGLDTMQAEPLLPSNPLATLPNVVLTPHVGGSTAGALNAMALGAVDTVLGFLSGDAMNPAACVNPDVLAARHSIPL